MKAALTYILLFVVATTGRLFAQQEVTVACLAFYNLENLFDTLDSPITNDFEFTPKGPNAYNTAVYTDKLSKLAEVISGIGTEYTPHGPAILGVSEVENIDVLNDLVRQPAIANRGYKIIHRDSYDGRGVDVALLYNPRYFTPEETMFMPLILNDDTTRPVYSRDILFVRGDFLGEKITVSVNHWPSRRGGEQTTAHLRNRAAAINRKVFDREAREYGVTRHIIMGDLNDDPINDSVRKHLKAGGNLKKLNDALMYNPWEAFYKKGLGTTAYQDAWSLFDQIIISRPFVDEKQGLRFHKAVVHNPSFLTQRSGTFKGYPLRSYSSGVYIGGYSDHFPVYILVIKERA